MLSLWSRSVGQKQAMDLSYLHLERMTRDVDVIWQRSQTANPQSVYLLDYNGLMVFKRNVPKAPLRSFKKQIGPGGNCLPNRYLEADLSPIWCGGFR